ncbi:hypothetical protein [Acetobacter fallax]|uniref:Uncharacterized protein n=1 Tax=Acetobacter fallax TaxID=1737473 RepID=A0ABX0K5K5_9PROT|nr:hypothetical protein [Acetobacter fallax]NHO31579.1 hypothetical protein [Acetobacter fallax]NHO35138.1 hypothetical protein [Acetobacter fallax]
MQRVFGGRSALVSVLDRERRGRLDPPAFRAGRGGNALAVERNVSRSLLPQQ